MANCEDRGARRRLPLIYKPFPRVLPAPRPPCLLEACPRSPRRRILEVIGHRVRARGYVEQDRTVS